MDPKSTLLVVARYAIASSKDLKGAFVGEQYFNVGGRSTDAGSSGSSDYETFRGHAADVLAHAIERNAFFGDWVDKKADQFSNCNNAKLFSVSKSNIIGRNITAFVETPEGLLVEFPTVNPKAYMNPLKTADGFRQYASLVDVAENTDEAIDRLFS